MASKNRPPGSRAQRVRLALPLLIVLLVVAASQLRACDAASGFCPGKCAVRCGRGRRKGRLAPSWCMKQCGLCCEECACVPTGRRSDECPCYRNMLVAGPRKTPKCP